MFISHVSLGVAGVASLVSCATARALPPTRDAAYSLSWGTCHPDVPTPEGFPVDCATLEVPLDYTDTQSDLLHLQLMRVNATKAPALGSVLINPGGPGGSGVEHLGSGISAKFYNTLLDGRYNLISFDPRGTGRTIPFTCNISEPNVTERSPLLNHKRQEIYQHANLTELLYESWTLSEMAAEACYEANADTGSFLGTAFVARDMLRIVEALNEDGLLHYWGTSYGSFLGDTFAAMFPDRVGHMLLDANVNPHEFTSGRDIETLGDTEKSFYGFLEECVDFPEVCPLVSATSSSTNSTDAESLLEEINSLLKTLASEAERDEEGEAVQVYLAIKNLIQDSLYQPSKWPDMAEGLTQALQANFSALIVPETSGNETDTESRPWDLSDESNFLAIKCSDASFRVDNPDELVPWVVEQEQTSGFADSFYTQSWACATWKFDAAERYEGDFKAHTNFPIFFVNSLYDPVTPVVSALNASSGFEGSKVLTHSGYGHGISAHPSVCLAKAVKSYFVDGVLPEQDAFCEREIPGFKINATQWVEEYAAQKEE